MRHNHFEDDSTASELDADAAGVVRLLLAVVGEDQGPNLMPATPPDTLRRAVRQASTPVLRGLIFDAVAELRRRK